MDRRRKTIFAFAIIAVVLVVGLWGIPIGNKQLAVSELTDEHIGTRVHVNGTVAVGTLRYMDNGSTILFTLTDGRRGVRSADSDEDELFHCACQIKRHIVHDLLQLGPDFRFIKRIYDLLRAIDMMLHFRYREVYRIVL